MPVRLLPAACCLAVLTAATDAPAQSSARELPPARAGLEAVAVPDTSGLESAVADQLGDARQAFERVATDPRAWRSRLADAYGALGRVYHAYELFGPAEAAYANAVRLGGDDAMWLHLLGYLYQQTGRFEEAAARLSAAVRVAPDDRAAALRLGDVWLELGRLQDARLQFEELLQVFPAAARRGLGEVALREGHYREALEQLRGALDRAPQADALHYRIAMAYRGLGRVEEARAHLRQRGLRDIVVGDPVADALASLVRGERLLIIRGTRAFAAGQFREAADLFERALAAAPSSVPARVNLASALLQLGETARAISHLQVAYAQAPGDLAAGRDLSSALLRLGRENEAMGVVRALRAANPDDEDTLVGLALLLAKREQYGEAIAMLDEAHGRFPARVTTATTLSRLLAASPELARRDGRRALELALMVHAADGAPADAETVALALAELGRCDEAAGWMQRGVEAANEADDTTEAQRLIREAPKYRGPTCRPPGH